MWPNISEFERHLKSLTPQQIAELDRAVAVKEREYGAKIVKLPVGKPSAYQGGNDCLIRKIR